MPAFFISTDLKTNQQTNQPTNGFYPLLKPSYHAAGTFINLLNRSSHMPTFCVRIMILTFLRIILWQSTYWWQLMMMLEMVMRMENMLMMMIYSLFFHSSKISQGIEILLRLLSQLTGQASVRAPLATKDCCISQRSSCKIA